MQHRKKARLTKAKSVPDWARDIRELSAVLKCVTQEEFAARLGSKQGTVSTWLRGDEARRPSADTFVGMAGLAAKLSPELASRFLRHTHISDESIFLIAERLKRDRVRELAPLVEIGDVLLIPRFRETLQGREEAGPPVPLPTEFVPNPLSTFCPVVDSKATAVIDSPSAVFILDETEKDAPNLLPFWNQVLFVRYDPETGAESRLEGGIYVGRLVDVHFWPATSDARYHASARFFLLSDVMAQRSLWVGYWAPPSLVGFEDIGTGHTVESPAAIAARKALKERARNELKLDRGWRVLGSVRGRLKLEGVENWAE